MGWDEVTTIVYCWIFSQGRRSDEATVHNYILLNFQPRERGWDEVTVHNYLLSNFPQSLNCNILSFCFIKKNILTSINLAVNFFHQPVFRHVPRKLGYSPLVSNSYLTFQLLVYITWNMLKNSIVGRLIVTEHKWILSPALIFIGDYL